MKNISMLVICAAFALVGCSSGGDYKLTGQPSQLKSSYESVKIIVNPEADDSSEAVADVRSSIAGQLMSGGQFHRISSADAPASLVITVNIKEYQHVSAAARVFMGVLAGRNRIVADISVTDGKTGNVIRSFEASGESASHPYSSEGSYSDALREFSKQVALGLSG